MLNNAKIYNVDESDIYKDACRLEHVLAEQYKTLMSKKEKLIGNLTLNRLLNHNPAKKYDIQR